MPFRHKASPVLILKLPSGKIRVTDQFGKTEELEQEQFDRYYEFEKAAPVNINTPKRKELVTILGHLQMEEFDEAQRMLEELIKKAPQDA